jgi:hypothetical protein
LPIASLPAHLSSFSVPQSGDGGGRVIDGEFDIGNDGDVALEPVECTAAACMVFLAQMLRSASSSEGNGSGSNVDENVDSSHSHDMVSLCDLVRLWQHSSTTASLPPSTSPSDRERLESAIVAFFCMPPHALQPHCLWNLFSPLRKQSPALAHSTATHATLPAPLPRVPAPPPALPHPPMPSVIDASVVGAISSVNAANDRIFAGASSASGAVSAVLQSPRHARVRSAARAAAAAANPTAPIPQLPSLPRDECVPAPDTAAGADDDLPLGAGLYDRLHH